MYQRTVKIYNGVDNIIELDVKNADQKRLDITQLKLLQMNVMDAAGNVLPNSPYNATATELTGIATVTIPEDDLSSLSSQYLKYSITAVDNNGNNIILYVDPQFGAVGTINLVGDAMPTFRDDVVYERFSGEINLLGNVIMHTSAIPTKFYEAIPTNVMSLNIDITDFIGQITVEATRDMTIAVSSWENAPILQTFSTTVPTTTKITFTNIPITGYNYIRVSWVYPDVWQYGSQQNTTQYGTVDRVTVSS